jgi:hypothetical protein
MGKWKHKTDNPHSRLQTWGFENGWHKVFCVKRLLCTNGAWQSLAKKIIGEDHMDLVFYLDEKSLQVLSKSIKNTFWKQIFEKVGKATKRKKR